MKPGADRDFWYAAWTVALVLLFALSVWVIAPKAGQEVHPSPKHPGVLLSHDLPAPAGEYVNHQELDELASTFAMRPYSIHCSTLEAWKDDPYSDLAWGYTTLEWDYAVLDPLLCAAAIDVAGGTQVSPAWARALAVSVHGRFWHGRADEALVECKAVRHWSVAMRMLGAGEDAIAELKGWALAMHWRLARLNDAYYAPACKVPNPW